MKFTARSLLSFCAVILLHTGTAKAGTYTLKGAVVTPEGMMVPEFTVIVRPISEKPELMPRKRFKGGVFSIGGLDRDKYQIQILAPRFIGVKMEVNFPEGTGTAHFRVIVLHKLRNEPRYPLGQSAFTVSVKTLQQKIPGTARDAYERAVRFHEDGRLDEALTAYGEAIRAFPEYVQALSDVGTVYILLNRPDSALTFLRRGARIDSSNVVIQLNIAVALMSKREYDQAIDVLDEIVESEPRKSIPRYYLARAYFHQNKYELAEKLARLAVEENADFLDAWVLLLNLGLERKDNMLAREGLTRLREAMNNKLFSKFVEDQLASLIQQ